MIHAETIDGTIEIQCGKASGTDLIYEATALVTSVVKSLCADENKPDVYDEELARTAFRCIVTGAGGEIEKRTGIDVFAPLSNDVDNDDEDDDDSDEVKPKDDDETEDDIPKFLF